MTIEMVCEKFQTNINSETPYASPVMQSLATRIQILGTDYR